MTSKILLIELINTQVCGEEQWKRKATIKEKSQEEVDEENKKLIEKIQFDRPRRSHTSLCILHPSLPFPTFQPSISSSLTHLSSLISLPFPLSISLSLSLV